MSSLFEMISLLKMSARFAATAELAMVVPAQIHRPFSMETPALMKLKTASPA
jgi:hypothetical protein